MSEGIVEVVTKVTFKLEKFDGDPPAFEGEKEPVEVITGGDGEPTRYFILNTHTNLLEEMYHGIS